MTQTLPWWSQKSNSKFTKAKKQEQRKRNTHSNWKFERERERKCYSRWREKMREGQKQYTKIKRSDTPTIRKHFDFTKENVQINTAQKINKTIWNAEIKRRRREGEDEESGWIDGDAIEAMSMGTFEFQYFSIPLTWAAPTTATTTLSFIKCNLLFPLSLSFSLLLLSLSQSSVCVWRVRVFCVRNEANRNVNILMGHVFVTLVKKSVSQWGKGIRQLLQKVFHFIFFLKKQKENQTKRKRINFKRNSWNHQRSSVCQMCHSPSFAQHLREWLRCCRHHPSCMPNIVSPPMRVTPTPSSMSPVTSRVKLREKKKRKWDFEEASTRNVTRKTECVKGVIKKYLLLPITKHNCRFHLSSCLHSRAKLSSRKHLSRC